MSYIPTSNLLQQGVSEELSKRIPGVIEECKKHGLDPYDLAIEEYNADEIAELGAYGGFPVRYPHFSFGQQYETLYHQYHSGMGKIYEMVINNDPTYMYLQRNNPLVDNLTVVAHALAHSDFFKNNIYFANTSRNMMNVMANHGQKIRQYMDIYGKTKVSKFLDSCLSIDDMIDPNLVWDDSKYNIPKQVQFEDPVTQFTPKRIPGKEYMDHFVNPDEYIRGQYKTYFDDKKKSWKNYPKNPIQDVLLFILKHIRLEPWQQNILSMVRDESSYFRPQMLTKVLNEGWASYWDSFIMTKCGFADDEGIVSYAKHHAGVLGGKYAMSNPYRLGNCLLRHVEKRWDKGQYGREWENCDDEFERKHWDKKTMKGREKIFQVRADYNDVNFINEFFTEDFCNEHEYFEYTLDPESNKYVVTSKDYKSIKSKILQQYVNGGRPVIFLTKFDKYGIELTHRYDGSELDPKYVEKTLKMMYNIVRMPITIKTQALVNKTGKTFGAIFAMAPDTQTELMGRSYKYNGRKFTTEDPYKIKDFPNHVDFQL
jgi:stage V sporulation protein R